MAARRGSQAVSSGPRTSKSMISVVTPSSAMLAGTGEGESLSMAAGFFPSRLTATLSALKIVGGCLLIGLGAAAIVERAGQARHAAGIWGGVAVIISGVLGAYSVRTGAWRVYVIGYLATSLLSLLTSVLVIIYSATGLAKDANQPYGVIKDEKGDIIPVDEEASNITGREAVMLINTLLIIAGFLDIVFGLPSVIICLRELCDCYNPSLLTGKEFVGRRDWLMSWLGQQSPVFYSQASGVPYGKLPLDGSQLFRPLYTAPRHSPPFIHIPHSADPSPSMPSSSRHSPKDAVHQHHAQQHHHHHHHHQQQQQAAARQSRDRSLSPNPRLAHSVASTRQSSGRQRTGVVLSPPPAAHYAAAAYPPMELYAAAGGGGGGSGAFYTMYPPPPHQMAAGLPSPGNMTRQTLIGFPHPMMLGYPPGPPPPHPHGWFYPPPGTTPDWVDAAGVYSPDIGDHRPHHHHHHHHHHAQQQQQRRDPRKRSRSKSQPKEAAGSRKKRKGPTDSDIERTYTGMDRELAEEFIEQTMEPSSATITVTADHHTVSGTESEAW